jgi:hypothetical protein
LCGVFIYKTIISIGLKSKPLSLIRGKGHAAPSSGIAPTVESSYRAEHTAPSGAESPPPAQPASAADAQKIPI